MKIRIGTRGSGLALYQANLVKDALLSAFPGTDIELVVIKTKGDKILDVALSKIGDKGLFTKELENFLFSGEIDVAVHSLKDIPTTLPEGLTLCAVTQREDRRDALVSRESKKLDDLNGSHKIATSSLRRKASLLRYNSSLKVIDIRGNIDTRLGKMQAGYCDAIVMAVAGLKRMGMEKHITEILPPDQFLPAVGQGALGLEIRADDTKMSDILVHINHPDTWTEISAERAFMKKLEGGCLVPVGCHTLLQGSGLTMTGFVSGTDGKNYLHHMLSGSAAEPGKLGDALAAALLDMGGDRVLREIRNSE